MPAFLSGPRQDSKTSFDGRHPALSAVLSTLTLSYTLTLKCDNFKSLTQLMRLHVLAQERASGMYRLSAIYFARSAADMPLDFAIPTIFILIIYLMGHLRYSAAAFFANYFTVLLLALVRSLVRE